MSFKTDVQPILDQLPDDYIRIFQNALCIVTGHEEAAPNIEDLVPEVKSLFIYLLSEKVLTNPSGGVKLPPLTILEQPNETLQHD